jgi:hypothetical protein
MPDPAVSITASIRNTALLRFGSAAANLDFYKQAALNEARQAGLASLETQAEKGNQTDPHTPVDTGALIATAGAGVNQFSVWFTIAGTLNGRPYGFAQERGWHQMKATGVIFIPGHHMVEEAAHVAAEAFAAFMGRTTTAIFSPQVTRITGGGDFYGL